MKEKLKLALKYGFPCLLIYSFGALLALIFWVMCKFKQIIILHMERFPLHKQGTIFIANHPSIIDPWIVAALFAKAYLRHPCRCAPIIVADKNNFCKSKYWSWFFPILISVDREDKHSAAIAFRKMHDALVKGKNIIIFPEGGRTFRGTNFSISPGGNRIRLFSGGLALLIKKTRAKVAYVWIDGSDKFAPNSEKRLFNGFVFGQKVTVKVGNPIDFESPELESIKSREEIVQLIANALLELADEQT